MTACDQVFERLTRGPFPSVDPTDAAGDAHVERHLASCHECRRLAEALRPAVELFHEALDANDDLPRYAGALSADDGPYPIVATMEPAAPVSRANGLRHVRYATAAESVGRANLEVQASQSTGKVVRRQTLVRRALDATIGASAVAAAVGVAVILASFAAKPPLSGASASGATIADEDWTRFAQVVSDGRVGEWALPGACANVATKREGVAVGSTLVACCTVCHAAGEPAPGAAADVTRSASTGMASTAAGGETHGLRPALLLSSCATCHY